MSFQKPLKFFIAYAHKDEEFKDELTIRLEPLKQEKKIEVWHDGKLKPGYKWRKVRDRYLHNADVVLYLVSSNSLASDKCNKEIASALDNQKHFVPIILRECDWRDYEISESSIIGFQALPKDGKPIKSWRDKDKAWQNVIDGLRKALDATKKQGDTLQSTLLELGNAKYMLGAFDEARVAYTKAIELKPDYARAYNNRGNLFSDLKQYEKAEADYNKAIELEPNEVAAYNSRGVLFYTLERYYGAEADFTKMIELKPDHAGAYYNRGNVLLELERYKKAKKDLNKAIELEPDEAAAYNSRGFLFGKLEQYGKAKADYIKAIELEPDYVRAYNNRGGLFYTLEQYDKAEADFTKAIELEPDEATAYGNRAVLFDKLEQDDKALADFTKARKLKRKPHARKWVVYIAIGFFVVILFTLIV